MSFCKWLAERELGEITKFIKDYKGEDAVDHHPCPRSKKTRHVEDEQEEDS